MHARSLRKSTHFPSLALVASVVAVSRERHWALAAASNPTLVAA